MNTLFHETREENACLCLYVELISSRLNMVKVQNKYSSRVIVRKVRQSASFSFARYDIGMGVIKRYLIGPLNKPMCQLPWRSKAD